MASVNSQGSLEKEDRQNKSIDFLKEDLLDRVPYSCGPTCSSLAGFFSKNRLLDSHLVHRIGCLSESPICAGILRK